jgi:hypothetical protein
MGRAGRRSSAPLDANKEKKKQVHPPWRAPLLGEKDDEGYGKPIGALLGATEEAENNAGGS